MYTEFLGTIYRITVDYNIVYFIFLMQILVLVFYCSIYPVAYFC